MMLSPTQRLFCAAGLLIALAGLGWMGFQMTRPRRALPTAVAGSAATAPAVVKPPVARQMLAPLFPDAPPASCYVLLSGQMYGYLQPCGCARPQVGGLERRYELVQRLGRLGVPVSAADLGDLAPHETGAQARQKYEIAVRSLHAMPYQALGMGGTEFKMTLNETLGSAQNYAPPHVVMANLRDENDEFPEQFRGWVVHDPRSPADETSTWGRLLAGMLAPGSMAGPIAAISTGRPRIGYIGLVGEQMIAKAQEKEATLKFDPPLEALDRALAELEQQGVVFRVLLFQGDADEARALHAARPGAVEAILCRGSADIAPRLPQRLDVPDRPATLLIEVGHKGKAVGVLHLSSADTGPTAMAVRYQMIEMVEELELPDEQTNPARELMRDYVLAVYQNQYLTTVPIQVHPLQQLEGMADARFVGAAKCLECHPGAHAVWARSKHSHAYQALVDYGRPLAELIRRGESPRMIGRQFDPECASCHVTGFGYRNGFVDAEQTPHLLGNQCENCHGPGSLHVAEPKDPRYFRPLRLSIGSPDTEKKCRSCHDGDNDPHFDLEKYWPHVKHPRF